MALIVGCGTLPIAHPSLSNLQNLLYSIDASNSIQCELCKLTVEILSVALKTGMGKSTLTILANYMCDKFKIETHRVCVLAIEQFKNEIWGIFVHGIFLPNQICGMILGDGCANKSKYFQSWNITIPKPTNYTPPSSDTGLKMVCETFVLFNLI